MCSDSTTITKELTNNGKCPSCGERIIKDTGDNKKRVFNKGIYLFEHTNNDGKPEFEVVCPKCLQHIILTFNTGKAIK